MTKEAPADLIETLEPWLTRENGPGPGEFYGFKQNGLLTIASLWDLTPRQAMVCLLEYDIWPLRFARNRGVFSAEAQGCLLSAKVAVIGCGGLGGQMITLLARAGVGRLAICDYDSFDESNLNRQFFCREDNLGRNKALVAAEELKQIASHLDVRAYPEAATADNLPQIIMGADVVVDCLDSIPTRHLVEAAAHQAGRPFVFGTIGGEEGLTTVTRPGGSNQLASLYGSPVPGEKGAEKVLGVPTLTPAALAVLEAKLVIRELLEQNPADPTLWHLDLTVPSIETLMV